MIVMSPPRFAARFPRDVIIGSMRRTMRATILSTTLAPRHCLVVLERVAHCTVVGPRRGRSSRSRSGSSNSNSSGMAAEGLLGSRAGSNITAALLIELVLGVELVVVVDRFRLRC